MENDQNPVPVHANPGTMENDQTQLALEQGPSSLESERYGHEGPSTDFERCFHCDEGSSPVWKDFSPFIDLSIFEADEQFQIQSDMGKKQICIANAEIEPQPQDPSHGSLGPNQSQDTPLLDQSLGPSANGSSALLVPQPQANDNSGEESTKIEVQITDHAGVRSTRGITCMSEIWNLTDGKKIELSFNGNFQPVEREGGIFNRFVGTVARKPDLCPINYFDWREVPKDYKEKCWTIIESKFHISKNEEEIQKIKHRTLMVLGEKWRNWKCALKAKHYDESKTVAEIVAEAPKTVNCQDFATLVNFWFGEKGQERSMAGKKASKVKKDVHTAGSKSFAQHAFDKFKKDGVAPNRGELYLKLHKKKNGMPVNEDASEKIDKLKELMSQEASDLPEGANGSIAWSSTDAFSKVMGKEKHGRVRGLGFGPTPSNRSGSKNSCYGGIRITSEEERLKDNKIRRLTDEESTLKDESAMLKQQNQLPANIDLQGKDVASGSPHQQSPRHPFAATDEMEN